MKIRHQIYAVTAVLISFFWGAALTPAFADDSDCWKKTGDAKLRACTRIITTGKLNGKPAHKDDIATMYRNRGDVFVQKRDYDRAIADYTQAIALNPNDLAAYDQRGLAYADKGDYDRAIADHTKAMSIDPKHPFPPYNRGSAYWKKGDIKRAIADFRKTLELDPSDKDAKAALDRLTAASSASSSASKDSDCVNKSGEAQFQACTRVIETKRFNGKPLSNHDLATVYSNRCGSYLSRAEGNRDYDTAIADCDQAIKIDPKNTYAYTNRCIVNDKKGDFDQAIADCSQAIKFDPKLAHAYSSRAVAYNSKRNYEKAISDATRAIELSPNYAVAYHNRAIYLIKAGKAERAVADSTKAIEINPKDGRLYTGRAWGYFKSGKPSQGLPDANRAVELTTDNASRSEALGIRGMIYAAIKKNANAVEDLEKAFGLDPNLGMQPDDPDLKDAKKTLARLKGLNAAQAADGCHPNNTDLQNRIRACTRVIEQQSKKSQKNLLNAYVSRGAAFGEKGEHHRAIADFTAATQIAPVAGAYALRGLAYHQTKDYDRAIADYTKAINLNPKGAEAYRQRASARSAKGDYDGAVADYGHAIQLEPNNGNDLNSRAWALYKSGRAADGIPDIENALKIDPEDAAYIDTHAHILESLGRKDEALAEFRKALEIKPDLKDSQEGLKRLQGASAPSAARSQTNIDCLQDKACPDGETSALAAFHAFCVSTQLDHHRLKAALSHYRSTSNPTGAGYLVIASGSNFIVEMRTIENKNGGSRRRCDMTGPSLSLKRLRKLVEQSYAASYLGEKETETGTKLAFSAANLAGLPHKMAIIVESIASPQHGVLPTTRFALLEIN
jgi:tetratricopeptide (TPR) repeat protein